MRKPTLPVVEIRFLDHAQCMGEDVTPIPITVYGLLIKETEDAYHVASWLTGNVLNGDQNEGFAIVKHKGIKLRVLAKIPISGQKAE